MKSNGRVKLVFAKVRRGEAEWSYGKVVRGMVERWQRDVVQSEGMATKGTATKRIADAE